MSHFEIKHAHGHVWLYWRGVVIWKLARDGRSSMLFQTGPRTTEVLPETDA